jgi:Uma2 family endonuclease
MASAPTFPLVSVDEYLNSSWSPDMEYVDGVLVERTVPTIAHSLLQIILGAYFRQFESAFQFKVLPEVRTQIIERARYRVPDLVLCPKPLPAGKVVNVVPLAVIEILSPDDRMGDTLVRFRDYQSIGIQHIIQMDPENHVAHRFENGSLLETRFDGLALSGPDRIIPFDSDSLFTQLRQERNELL